MANSKNRYRGTLCFFYTFFTTGCGHYMQQMRPGDKPDQAVKEKEIKREPEEQRYNEFDPQLQYKEKEIKREPEEQQCNEFDPQLQHMEREIKREPEEQQYNEFDPQLQHMEREIKREFEELKSEPEE